MCVCVCVCVCVCACVSACVYVRACVHADRLHTYKEKERGHLLFCLIICEYKFHYFLCISLVGCGHIIRRGSSHCPAAHSEKLSLVCTRWCRKQLRSFVPNLFMTYEQSNDYVKFYDFFLTGQDGFFRGASSGGVDGGEMKKVNGCQRSMKRNFQVYTSWPRFKNKTKQNKQTNKTNKQTTKKKPVRWVTAVRFCHTRNAILSPLGSVMSDRLAKHVQAVQSRSARVSESTRILFAAREYSS